ncbi:hypothetical protein Drorol1_Dr00025487 [Drosera rotundifolia]
MDFIDDDTTPRPRFILRSQPPPLQPPAADPNHRLLRLITTPLSLLLFTLTLLYVDSQFLQPLFLWVSLSLLLGPFAPPYLTAGHIHVGQGCVIEFPTNPETPPDESRGKPSGRRQKGKRVDEFGSSGSGQSGVKGDGNEGLGFGMRNERNGKMGFEGVEVGSNGLNQSGPGIGDFGKLGFGMRNGGGGEKGFGGGEEREWSEEDLELLRKVMVKYPVGKHKRWEVIAEVFDGRYMVSSVIKAGKALGEAKPEDKDSYSRFLRNRKRDSVREVDGEGGGQGGGEEGKLGDEVKSWSSGEDIALLNALKVFRKDVAMRWEKIAAAVPGKSKAACMKRVSELKKDFRSSKAAPAGES